MLMLGFLFSLYSESSTTLNLGRFDGSCVSKDQKKTPLTSSTYVNQTRG